MALAARSLVLGYFCKHHAQTTPIFSKAARQAWLFCWHDGRPRSFVTSVRFQAPPRALIVGGGPAGCTTAYFLAKAGFNVTVSERSTRPPHGQGIDITNQAVDVVKRMDILDKIKANTTGETGFALLDDEGRRIGSLLGFNVAQHETEGHQGVFSPTNELEIMRGTLNKLLANAAKEKHVEFRYGCTINEIKQYTDRVDAVLSDRQQVEPYSVIIGADGVGSLMRKLVFPSEVLTIDREGVRQTGYFITTTPTSTALDELATKGDLATREQQRSSLEALYADMRGFKDLIVRGMYECDDWHFTRLSQIKLPTWHVGRCALVGDAAYCPTPLTGQGTSMALIGSYILAGELAANITDPQAAFAAYKRMFDPYVNEEGKIPFGGRAQNIFVPESRFALWTLRHLYRAFSNGYGSSLLKLASPRKKAEDIYKLPIYQF
ncbi:hypothetical protein KC349_g3411 [Hortaea werneckii]|nr:hypothetical protein KC349_g3411 [Hortaea werneckii]